MMKRLVSGFVVVLLALVAVAEPAAAARPGQFTVLIAGIDYGSYGDAAQGTAAQDRWVSVSGLAGGGDVSCDGEASCLSSGFDGGHVAINQDLQIVIDVIGAGVVSINGQTRGSMEITGDPGQISLDFAGTVVGTASCSAGVCGVSLSVRGLSPGHGIVELALNGQLDLTGPRPAWLGLGGTGSIVSHEDMDQI